MPIIIYDNGRIDLRTIDQCSPDEWELPGQIHELEQWLKANHDKIPPGKYVADIGFQIRREATGGGSVISSEMIQLLAKMGMEIYLSEYGPDSTKAAIPNLGSILLGKPGLGGHPPRPPKY
jgi:hypothetical protein